MRAKRIFHLDYEADEGPAIENPCHDGKDIVILSVAKDLLLLLRDSVFDFGFFIAPLRNPP